MALFRGSRNDLKQVLGWAPRPTHPAPVVARAYSGQSRFSFAPLMQNPDVTDIFVAMDKVRLTEGHDYFVDWNKHEIRINHEVLRLDGGEEIEIRSTGPTVDPLQRIVLLPREFGGVTFTDEQLEDLMSDVIGNIFAIDQLIRYPQNVEKLKGFSGKHIQVKAAQIEEEGIVGTEQVVIVV